MTENMKLINVTIIKNIDISLFVSFCGKEKLFMKFNGFSKAKLVSFSVLK